jgi:DNA-binding transcriptional LysR family regulator
MLGVALDIRKYWFRIRLHSKFVWINAMELRHLRYFIAVAEELNFTRAAERLHIAQPPLSTQIRGLEDELGAELFIRENRRVYLTPAGQELLDRARLIIDAAAKAKAAARNAANGVIGRLALAYTASAMFTERLPAAIRGFVGAHPHVELTLHEMVSLDQFYALHERTLDVGILRKPDVAPPDGVEIEPWYHAPLIAAIPKDHALARRKGIRINDLRDAPLITYPRDAGIGLYWPVLQLCAKAGFRPNIVREAREPSVMIGLVSAGVGVAIVPADTQCIRLAGVAYQRIIDDDAVSTLYLSYRADDDRKHLKALLSALRVKAPKSKR